MWITVRLLKSNMYLIIISFLLNLPIECQRKDFSRHRSQYASSLFRQNHILEGVPEIDVIENLSTVSHCLVNCMNQRPSCQAFNWGKGVCVLLSDSVCANDSLLLTPKQDFAYYDVMDSPDFEKKHLTNQYCGKFGKCSGRCYPRKPHYINTPMTWFEAQELCSGLGRALPQPRSSEENAFYVNFIKKLLEGQADIRNQKDMKYWFGLTDKEVEGIWMYVDSTPVSDSFTAWALGQPDNGGSFGKSTEDCGAIGEKGDFKWFDVNCKLKLKFFCA